MPTIDVAHPPQLVMRLLNPTLRTALRVPGLGASLKDFMVLEYTGRKSGRRFSVTISAHHLDGELYAMAEAGWKYNFADGAPADVWYRGKQTPMQGQLIKDPATVADIAHRVATGYGAKKAQRSMGLSFSTPTVPSLDDFAEAIPRLHIGAIKLTPRT
ncbi:hypothetical protein TUM20985_28140 [Mycobacterium antarcticum]|uniref:hypothetical protein n=1 Tax=unclassified Mycolicibacterium TaxID=2636767 RepID=UPI002388E2AE|nr:MULTISPECIES: hypothetical protein [unclassified Mycolicibacterium]BDX32267.1 hypothetical protein TUM20985_28140 [Mycolicibacterium sp. TUM20985]GLP84181.1 hypothetical protein TUM20984_56010 [Mycolicibacterium sp. TUM20984]